MRLVLWGLVVSLLVSLALWAPMGEGGLPSAATGEELDPGMPPPSPSASKKWKRGRKGAEDVVAQVRETLVKMKLNKADAEVQTEGCEKLAEIAAGSSEGQAEVGMKALPRVVAGMQAHPGNERVQEAGCWALSAAAAIVDATMKLGLAAQSRHLGVVSPSLTSPTLSNERNLTDKVLTRIAKHEGIQTLVDALRRNAPAGQRMSVDVPSESMMECGLTLIAGISGLDMPGPREPEPRKWQISRAGGIEAVVRSMMANPGSELVQHRGTQILRNLHTQLTDWAHKHRKEVAEVGIVEGILLSLEMHPGASAVQENGLFVLLTLASNQGTNLEHNINLGRSLISAPTASAREDLDITRENIAAAGGVEAAARAMRAHPDDVLVQVAGAWLLEVLLRWTPTGAAANTAAAAASASGGSFSQPSRYSSFSVQTEHGDAVVAAEGDQLVVAAMHAHPAHHKLQQLGCSILASLAANKDGSLPLPVMPRMMADMPHRTHRHFQVQELIQWLFSKFSPSPNGFNSTPASVEAVMNALMLTTGKTDRPWTLVKHGTKGDRYAALRRTEEYKTSLNTMKACMQALADMVHNDPVATRSVLGDRQLRVSDGVTKGKFLYGVWWSGLDRIRESAATAASLSRTAELYQMQILASEFVLRTAPIHRLSDRMAFAVATHLYGSCGRIVLHTMRSHNQDNLAQEYGCTALRQLASYADASVNDPSLAEGSDVQPTNCGARSSDPEHNNGDGDANVSEDEECTYAIGSMDVIAHIQLDRSFDQAESCMADWRWFWVSPRVFLVRSFRSYQAHQDKHQTFFAIVRVISITSLSWMFCTHIIWPVYDRAAGAFCKAVYGAQPQNRHTAVGSETKEKRGGNGKDGFGARPSAGRAQASDGGDGACSTAAKKFAAEQAAKIARGPSTGKPLTAAEISARAKKAKKQAR